MELSTHESEAKEIMLVLGREVFKKSCLGLKNDGIFNIIPEWCDYEKFKRGQRYFLDNRYGMLTSNLHGLVTLLAEPHGLLVLDSTRKSSTPETAKYRYVSTIVHTLSWYEVDLSPESEIVKSIKTIRKMHFNASKNCEKENVGIVTQAELVFTSLGFIGLTLIRPHHFGIRHDCKEDREAFLHVWAVLLNMLGVEDQYNICLKSIEVVEIIFRVLLRNVFVLYIQIESERFQKMVNALCDGLKSFIPFLSYEVLMFEVKRTIGIPGYQYGVEMRSIDEVYRQIFTRDEHLEIQEKLNYPNNNIRMEFEKCDSYDGIILIKTNSSIDTGKFSNINNDKYPLNMLKVVDNEFDNFMNKSEFDKLSFKGRLVVRLRIMLYSIYIYNIGKRLLEWSLGKILKKMKTFKENTRQIL